MIRNYNIGNVSATSSERGAQAGGIAGTSAAIITNSYNIGTVSATTNVTTGNYYAEAGGIAGYQNGANGIISGSYNTGAISISSNSSSVSTSHWSNAGGILGRQTNGTVSKCYNTGSITATSNAAEIFLGGITGRLDGNNASISYSYNTGNVSATSTGNGRVIAAGIVGYRFSDPVVVSNNAAANSSVSGTTSGVKKLNRMVGFSSNVDLSAITGNIALSTMEDDEDFGPESEYLGEDKTELELKTQATYEAIGWLFGDDADKPWKPMSTPGEDYPHLYWE
jgi:hypothetical protein